MHIDLYKTVVENMTTEVLRALRKAEYAGLSRNSACGLSSAVVECLHATTGQGVDRDILGVVNTTALVRFKQGLK